LNTLKGGRGGGKTAHEPVERIFSNDNAIWYVAIFRVSIICVKYIARSTNALWFY